MKFMVKKLETVATTAVADDPPTPWKETKIHCL